MTDSTCEKVLGDIRCDVLSSSDVMIVMKFKREGWESKLLFWAVYMELSRLNRLMYSSFDLFGVTGTTELYSLYSVLIIRTTCCEESLSVYLLQKAE